MVKRRMAFCVGLLLAFGLISSAHATTITFGDRTSWENNVENITTHNFDTLEGSVYETLTCPFGKHA